MRGFHSVFAATDIDQVNHILHWSDYAIIGAYFLGIIGVGFWASKRSESNSISGYFLANRSMNWILVGASLYSSNIGSGLFVGLAGSGASSGIAISMFELNAMFVLLLLGWYFVPVYLSSGVSTMPEYLKKRFGGQRIRVYLSILSLILYIFTKISSDLYSGALFIKQALGLNMYISVVILVGISAVFTIGGGLTAVMWTDFIQTIIMIVGAFVLMILSLIKVGGYSALMQEFGASAEPTNPDYIAYKNNCTPTDNNTCVSCSAVTKYYDHLFRPVTDEELPWTGIIFGLTVSAVWNWCTDQVIVQRALSAKNITHAKAGYTVCSCLKAINLYLLVVPGMAARILWPNEIGCSNPDKCQSICGSEKGCTNIAYPLLVLRLMPIGVTGLMLSVMMAALMSSLTSIFNSASTIFTIDIYTRFRKNASEIEQVIMGRVFVLFMVVVSIVWIPIIESSQNSELFHYIQSVTSYLAPPVCAVYVLAIFWSRINEKGAFWALVIGLAIGIIRFALEFSYSVPTCASGLPDPRPIIISKVHYLHFGIILFVISCVVAIVISLLTDPIDENKLYRLTYFSRFSDKIRSDIDNEDTDNGVVNDGFSVDHNSGDSQTNDKKRNENIEIVDSFDKNKLFYTICCISSEDKNDNQIAIKEKSLTAAEEAVKCATDIKEEPFWESLNNSGAIIVIVFASFIWGYYY